MCISAQKPTFFSSKRTFPSQTTEFLRWQMSSPIRRFGSLCVDVGVHLPCTTGRLLIIWLSHHYQSFSLAHVSTSRLPSQAHEDSPKAAFHRHGRPATFRNSSRITLTLTAMTHWQSRHTSALISFVIEIRRDNTVSCDSSREEVRGSYVPYLSRRRRKPQRADRVRRCQV